MIVRPAFIVIEGCDGASKSTQAKLLTERLGYTLRAFPDRSTPIGQLIDGYLKGEWYATRTDENSMVDVPNNALIFQGLMLANRTELLEKMQLDIRLRGLVCDRYWQSGYAYGSRDGLDLDYLISMHAGLPQPELSILIDVNAKVASARLRARGNVSPERYDAIDSIRRVIENYRKLWTQQMRIDQRWVIVDGTKSVEKVREAVFAAITERVHT